MTNENIAFVVKKKIDFNFSSFGIINFNWGMLNGKYQNHTSTRY